MLLPLKQFQTRNNEVLMTTHCRVTKQAAVPSFPGGGDQEINADNSVGANLSVKVRLLLLQHRGQS